MLMHFLVTATDFIKEVKNHVTIREVIEYYGFKPNRAHKICCPFHGEKTPSLHIYAKTNTFHCFGCGIGGDSVKFVAELYKLNQYEAARKINTDMALSVKEPDLNHSAPAPDTVKQKKEEEIFSIWCELKDIETACINAFDELSEDDNGDNLQKDLDNIRSFKAIAEKFGKYGEDEDYKMLIEKLSTIKELKQHYMIQKEEISMQENKNDITEEQEKPQKATEPSILEMIFSAQKSGNLTDDILKEIGKLLTSNNNKPPEWLITGKNGYTVNEPKFIQTFCKDRDLHCINESFYDINGAVSETTLKKEIQNQIQEYIVTSIARKTENLFKALQISVSEDNFSPDLREIHLLNGVLHVDGTFEPEKRFCLNRLQVEYNPSAPKPKVFLKCLHDMLEDDDILTLQEYGGYLMIPETAAQKCLSVIGNGGEGKTTVIGDILKTIFSGNILAESIDKLATDKFILNDLENKLVFLDDDIKTEKLADTSMIKKIVTNKGQTNIEGKYKSRHSGNMYARVLMLGNDCLQALFDTSNGFFRRQLIIKTKPKTRPEEKDTRELPQILQNEIQGIFNWYFEGLQRLIKNGFHFTVSENSKQILENLKIESFNFLEFLNERMMFDPNEKVSTADILLNYAVWCGDNAELRLKDKRITKYLADNCRDLKIERTTLKNNKGIQVRGYKGLKFKIKYVSSPDLK